MDAGELVDLGRLEELHALLGPEEFRGFLRDFLEEAAEAVTKVGADRYRDPSPERAELFHYLAGAAHNVGAISFGAFCVRLEKSAERLGAAEYQAFCAEFRRLWRFFDDLDGAPRIALAG